ncbi:MAG TPA: dTDP-glucose 4,6-dehydratase [Thermotogota bacterium]|nr:dTDP-glucose 4,6-dehydratase [Thermotogota bacterium]
MRYLVTGGLGFIGSAFVRGIRAEEPESQIVVLDALSYAGNLENVQGCLEDGRLFFPSREEDWKERFLRFLGLPGVVVVIGDVCDTGLVEELLPQINAVVHFAAESHVDRSLLDPEPFFHSNVRGTFSLLQAMRKVGNVGKFVHVSTDEVYGEASERSFSEEDPLHPRNPYSATKAAAEQFVLAQHHSFGLPVNIIRPTNNFGPFQYPEKLIPLMISRAMHDQPLPVYGDGKQSRDWLFVEDTVQAIRLLVQRGKNGEVYNLAGHNERQNIEVVRRILRRLGKPESLIRHVEDRPGHDRRYALDDSKIRSELGLGSGEAFEERLDQTIDWYVNSQDWWRRIREGQREYQDFMGQWYKDRT